MPDCFSILPCYSKYKAIFIGIVSLTSGLSQKSNLGSPLHITLSTATLSVFKSLFHCVTLRMFPPVELTTFIIDLLIIMQQSKMKLSSRPSMMCDEPHFLPGTEHEGKEQQEFQASNNEDWSSLPVRCFQLVNVSSLWPLLLPCFLSIQEQQHLILTPQ